MACLVYFDLFLFIKYYLFYPSSTIHPTSEQSEKDPSHFDQSARTHDDFIYTKKGKQLDLPKALHFFSHGKMFASIPDVLLADGICQKLPRMDGPWSHVAGSRLRQLPFSCSDMHASRFEPARSCRGRLLAPTARKSTQQAPR